MPFFKNKNGAAAKAQLFNVDLSEELSEQDRNLLIQQYIQYLDMADRISERRTSANVFFLTLNTGILTACATLENYISKLNPEIIRLGLIGLMLFCFTWVWLLRSYRTLNRGKFTVVSWMEKQLPASPFDAEWVYLGEGKIKQWGIHIPLTPIEILVPFGFIGIYGYLTFYF